MKAPSWAFSWLKALAAAAPVTRGTDAVPVDVVALARAALALLPAVRPVPARGARLVAVDT